MHSLKWIWPAMLQISNCYNKVITSYGYIGWYFFYPNHRCVKSVRIRSYSGPHFSHIFLHSDWITLLKERLSVFSPNAEKCEKNVEQNNSEYTFYAMHFLWASYINFYLKKYNLMMLALPGNKGIGRSD